MKIIYIFVPAMKAIQQLKEYGFIIPEKLETILKKLPADAFNHIEFTPSKKSRKAKIWCDPDNKTDIIIEQQL